MQVTHPSEGWNSIPPENIFIVTDEMGIQAGSGYLISQFQPNLYPDCPINIYLSMDSQPAGQFMLFGALIARARQLRDVDPSVSARVYTCVQPEDSDSLAFYTHGGMNVDDREVLVRMPLPVSDGRVPMNCALEQTPLNAPAEVNSFLARLAQNDITHIDQPSLMQMMFSPHFHAMGMFYGQTLISEALFAGSGNSVELTTVYVTPEFRRRGMASALIQACVPMLAAEGVTEIAARIVTRSEPQSRLARHFNASEIATTAVFPSLYL